MPSARPGCGSRRAAFRSKRRGLVLDPRANAGYRRSMPGRLLHPREAATYLSVSPATLERWRRTGEGPKFVKLGRARNSRIAYRAEDIDAYVDEHRRSSTADPGDP